jgi:hypothetical protein
MFTKENDCILHFFCLSKAWDDCQGEPLGWFRSLSEANLEVLFAQNNTISIYRCPFVHLPYRFAVSCASLMYSSHNEKMDKTIKVSTATDSEWS